MIKSLHLVAKQQKTKGHGQPAPWLICPISYTADSWFSYDKARSILHTFGYNYEHLDIPTKSFILPSATFGGEYAHAELTTNLRSVWTLFTQDTNNLFVEYVPILR